MMTLYVQSNVPADTPALKSALLKNPLPPEKNSCFGSEVVPLAGTCDLHLAINKLRSMPRRDAVSNNLAACYLRVGQPQSALDLLIPIVLRGRGVLFVEGLQPVIYRNYATALLMVGNPAGALDVLRDVNDMAAPRSVQIRQDIANWVNTLSFLRRWDWKINRIASMPAKVEITFVPGEFLEVA